MAENDKFETLGDAYAKYPQSTLVMRKQYVDELNARIEMKDSKQEYITKIWCGMCNFYGAISGKETCSKCPFKDDTEMCYDDEYCDYDKFEEFLKGINLSK